MKVLIRERINDIKSLTLYQERLRYFSRNIS